ncbi:MAG: DUF3883 domain-containing protein, partial [Paracoccaceae bacterium]|nr:DUF3883 domain-containing protein [Paracoccaceae bacterium]
PTIQPTAIHSDKSKSNPNTQSTTEERQFIGCIGEWQAYQFMKQEFGPNVITPDSWVSEIRRKFLPPIYGEPDNISDSHGFDFRFTFNSKRWHVEVKSTKSDETQFDLGVTEIEASVRFANQNQLGLWRILRIRNTLSKNPNFDWLPNPFEEEYKDRFRFKENGMRLSYRPMKS